MGWKYGFPCRRGFLLVEALLVALILTLGAAFTMPSLRNWQEERELDMAAQTLAASIRQAAVLAKNDAETSVRVSRNYHFNASTDANGRVVYYTSRGARRMKPSGTLPSRIILSGSLALVFDKQGFAGRGQNYSVYLYTKDRKYKRQVTVAMYTGRVRVT